MPITPELLDRLMKDYQSPSDLLGQVGLLQHLTKALLERALEGELTHHPGYEKHSPERKTFATLAMAKLLKPFAANSENSQSMSLVIVTLALSLN
jgi:hypothetical protein